jgi:hypothetical protein
MIDEIRDPELAALRPYWQPPAPSDALDGRVLLAYRHKIRTRSRIRHLWISVVAAVVLAAISGAVSRVRPADTRTVFVPVRQPHIIVISQGERP